jgi:hypothetical protein
MHCCKFVCRRKKIFGKSINQTATVEAVTSLQVTWMFYRKCKSLNSLRFNFYLSKFLGIIISYWF